MWNVEMFPSGDIFIIDFLWRRRSRYVFSRQWPLGDIKYQVNILLSWDITPCSSLKVNRRFGGTYRLHLQCRRISQARNQREVGGKDSFQLTTRRYIPEDSTLHNHRCENLKSYILLLCLATVWLCIVSKCARLCCLIHLLLWGVLGSHRRKFVSNS
jgi:hypothetical protein